MTDKEKQAAILTIVCMLAIAVILAGVGICRIYKSFSSPSSEVGVDSSASTFTFDPNYIIMNVSAYCPGKCCCGKWADGFTASGKPAVGKIVAAPSDTKFGTVLDIPGYGYGVVQDRGGAITGNKLDVLFSTHAEALEWGRQYLMVEVKAEPG